MYLAKSVEGLSSLPEMLQGPTYTHPTLRLIDTDEGNKSFLDLPIVKIYSMLYGEVAFCKCKGHEVNEPLALWRQRHLFGLLTYLGTIGISHSTISPS